MEMWTTQEFANVLKRHPEGGTLWTGSHRTVRYIRVFRKDDSVVAVLTEHVHWKPVDRVDVELFVKTSQGAWVSELTEASKTPEFLKRILNDPILENINNDFRPAVEKFLSSPDKTYIPTW